MSTVDNFDHAIEQYHRALGEFMRELTNIMKPVTDTEIVRARDYLALGYSGNFQKWHLTGGFS